MRTQQIIEASADVLTIVSLKRGDVYKRVIPSTSWEQSKLQFGIVTSIMHNGSEGAIAAIEYGVSYTGLDVKQVVMTTGDSDVPIYPAVPEEVAEHLAQIRETVAKKVRDAESALDTARKTQVDAEAVLSGIADLTAPETEAGALAR